MSEALHQNDNPVPDSTTSAVYEVIKTLGGDAAACDGPINRTPVPEPAEEPPEQHAIARTAQLPERLNMDLEERLIDIDVFGRRTMAQRRVLGCLACKLGCKPGNTGMVRSLEIADCQGTSNTATRRILGRLVQGGFLKIEKHEDDIRPGKPPDYYRFTGRAVHYAFKRSLEAPDECGLGTDGTTRRFNGEAESLLIGAGVLEKRGSVPRNILGCLACRLQTGENGITAQALKNCTGTNPSHSLIMLRRMVDAGALEVDPRPRTSGPGSAQLFRPADTGLGRELVGKLEAPDTCDLKVMSQKEA